MLEICDCTADLSSRLEECVSASSVSACWYIASFRKGGSSKPNELPESAPGQVPIFLPKGLPCCGCLLVRNFPILLKLLAVG